MRLLVAVTLSGAAPAQAGFQNGRSLLELCGEPRAVCLSYLMGVVDGIDAMGWERMDPALCVPDKVEDNRVRYLFLQYARNHPERLHLPAGLLVVDALKQDWACPDPHHRSPGDPVE